MRDREPGGTHGAAHLSVRTPTAAQRRDEESRRVRKRVVRGEKDKRKATETEMVRSCERGIPARVYVGSLLLLIHFHCVTVRGGKRTSVWLERFIGLYTFFFNIIFIIIIETVFFF